MGLSKSQRIQILLGIDLVFFFIELVTGYTVHSLALVADSFHMLNDVLSLCVGLWAVRVAGSGKVSTSYTYGWQRAETLGALINGVFLVALCVTIFLEAIQRFVEPQEVSNPQIILIVGSLGLLSNILGLFLFHDHGHSHGHGGGHSHGHSHSHSHGDGSHKHTDELGAAEEGCGSGHMHGTTSDIANESGNIAEVLPQVQTGAWGSNKGQHVTIQSPDRKGNTGENSDSAHPRGSTSSRHRGRSSGSRPRAHSGMEDIPVHPASFRNDIIMASRQEDTDSVADSDTDGDYEHDLVHPGGRATVTGDDNEQTPLIKGRKKSHESHRGRRLSGSNGKLHKDHKHSKPKDASKGGHGHSHDLNMRGVFLHVLGDALGNVGVIATALFIWLTDYKWRFYSDPAISLVITVIILCSAIPLCKAASRILLQGVPAGLDVGDIEADIESLPGIDSCHDLHVWQLSDTKLVASLHVKVTFGFKGEGSHRYMTIAKQIRECLHAYGIHSSTIQPEFCTQAAHGHEIVSSREHTDDEDNGTAAASTVVGDEDAKQSCLLDCDDDCGENVKCCAPAPAEGTSSKKK